MAVWHAWGNLDPIAIICLIVIISVVILAILLLTITQRRAAQEVYDSYNEYSHSLDSNRPEMRRKRRVQTTEILNRPRSARASFAHQSTILDCSSIRDSTFDPYRVLPRKPVPSRAPQAERSGLNDEHDYFMSGALPNEPETLPPRHSPLYFEKPGYSPVPIFDEHEEQTY